VRAARRERGIVLVMVLVFALLLVSSIATFERRAVVDAVVSRNRENGLRAEALARGGLEFATALVLDDKLQEGSSEPGLDSHLDLWHKTRDYPIPVGGGTVRLTIRDTGELLNLNAVFNAHQGDQLSPHAKPFLVELLSKVVGDLNLPPDQESPYDASQLADNLIDWADPDHERQDGGDEDAFYQQQDPPYRAPNHALLSVEELRLVEGFDARLAKALESYVTVYPYAGTQGVNLNTAPPHVLALVFSNDGVDYQLATEEVVEKVVAARDGDHLICGESSGQSACTPISEIVTNAQAIFPPPTFATNVFLVEVEARLGDVTRTLEAVIDRSDPANLQLLSWRMR
jgi:type II secretory pathway component PulK